MPNPYIVFNGWEPNLDNRQVKFTHLPMHCTIRIFTLSGDLVRTLEHSHQAEHPLDRGGTECWNLMNDHRQLVAPGVYVFRVESEAGDFAGKVCIIH